MSGWPDQTELGELFVTAKLTKAPPEGLDGLMESAIADLEERTGWRPFLAEGTVSRLHSPPDAGLLWLACGFLTVTSVYYGVTSTDAGTLLAQDTDYELLPVEAPDKGMPYDRIRFFSGTGSTPRSVQVTGVAGRMYESDPAFKDVKLWVMRGAMASVALETMGQDGPMKRLKQGPVEMEFAVEVGRSRIEQWASGYERMCARHRRLVV